MALVIIDGVTTDFRSVPIIREKLGIVPAPAPSPTPSPSPSVLNFLFPLVRTGNDVRWKGATTQVPEGTNLYWRQDRFDAAFALAFLPALEAAISAAITVIDGNDDSDDSFDFNSDDYSSVLDCNGP